jgi:hypothetical protein
MKKGLLPFIALSDLFLSSKRDVFTALYEMDIQIYSETSVHERPCSRTNFPSNKRLGLRTRKLATAASWQQRQTESIGAGVSVAG